MNIKLLQKSCGRVLAAFTLALSAAANADTISENVTLTGDADWRSKGTVTIAEGVTVNLNAHKLTLAGLAGSGVITGNPIVDLTTTDAKCASYSKDVSCNTPASNVFNNNFRRDGSNNGKRILIDIRFLPLGIDYDFGAGNEKVVNMYKVYCGPIPYYTVRSPKSWVFRGSNDKSTWVDLDNRTSGTDWAMANSDSECRIYEFENATAYRYYRFEIQSAQDNTDGYVEIVQLEYFDVTDRAELRLEIPEDVVVDNQTVTINGNVKLVKDGPGTFVASKAGQTYGAGTHVVAGTLKCGTGVGKGAVGGGREILVDSGATFDVNGWPHLVYHDITLAGGTLANTGASLPLTQAQVSKLMLTADSYFCAFGSLGMISSNNGISTLDLGGHTLNLAIGPDAVFHFVNTDVTQGTVKVVENEGVLSFDNMRSRMPNATLELKGAVVCNASTTVGDLRLDETVVASSGAGTLWVYGSLVPLTDSFCNLELQDGSTLDLAGLAGELNLANADADQRLTFARNATVTVNLEGRTPALNECVLRWPVQSRPVDTTFNFDAETTQSGIQLAVTDTGLFRVDSSVAEYADWTGGGRPGDVADPANWACVNTAGQPIDRGLPSDATTLRFSGLIDIQIPAETPLRCKAIQFGNCQLGADCDWRGVTHFTMTEGSDLHLNGHSLSVSNLDGAGKIHDATTFTDLTTPDPDGSKVSSPTVFNAGKAANIFNNNYTRSTSGSNGRVLVATANLPMIVDYNFGTPTTINTYRIWCGPMSGYQSRCVRTWTVEGSDDGNTWTVVDAQDGITWPTENCCKTFPLAQPATYSRLRFKVTASSASSNDPYMEMVQLEYGQTSACGELHVDVPAETLASCGNVTIEGAVRLFKEGAGTFVLGGTQTYNAGTQIDGGTLARAIGFGASGSEVVVGRGTTLEARGYLNNLIVLDGGTLHHGRLDCPRDFAQMTSMRLTADSTMRVASSFGFIGSGYNPTTLDLGGYELTVDVAAGKSFWLDNAAVTAGKLAVTGAGTLAINSTSLRGSEADFDLGCAQVTAAVNCDVGGWTVGTNTTVSGNGTVTIHGTYRPLGDSVSKYVLADGATVDLSDRSAAFDIAGKNLVFAAGADFLVDVGERTLKPGAELISWADVPSGVSFALVHPLTEADNLLVRDGGLYYFSAPAYATIDAVTGDWLFFTASGASYSGWEGGVTSDIEVRFSSKAEYDAIRAKGVKPSRYVLTALSLTEDTDLSKEFDFVVAPNVTIDLEGRKLRLPAKTLEDSVLLTITDTAKRTFTDLTTPDSDGSKVSSPTVFNDGKAASIFNNNYTRSTSGGDGRVLVVTANLPMVVDYNFGTPTTIDTYRIWCGPISGYQGRCPKTWTVEGSDDGNTWTVVDAQDNITWPGENCCKTFPLAQPATYSRFRFKATAASSNSYFEMVQLEYGLMSAPGELHVDAPAGTQAVNDSVTIDGELRLVKEGAGTLVLGGTLAHVGGTRIDGGTAKVAANLAEIGARGSWVVVGPDATLEMDGKCDFYRNRIALAGGTLQNTGAEIADDAAQVAFVLLTADSTMRIANTFGFIGSGYTATTLVLGGHELAVDVANGKSFWLDNADVTPGKLTVTGAGTFAINATSLRGAEADFDLGCARVTAAVNCDVHDWTVGTNTTVSGNGAVTIRGAYRPLGDSVSKYVLADGATLDLSGRGTAFDITGKNVTFANDATILVNPPQKKGGLVVPWTEPANLSTLTFRKVPGTDGILSVGTQGIFIRRGMTIFVR